MVEILARVLDVMPGVIDCLKLDKTRLIWARRSEVCQQQEQISYGHNAVLIDVCGAGIFSIGKKTGAVINRG